MSKISTWQLDPAHTTIEFAVKHMMFTTVRGRFKNFTGAVVVDEDDPNKSKVDVEIDVSSLDTGVPDRDAHLRSADFFDAETHPKLTFRTSRVSGAVGPSAKPGHQFKVNGELTIRGKSMPVDLSVTFAGIGKDPWGKQRAGFNAEGQIDRREWGLQWNQALETGGVLVGNSVKIEIEAQAVNDGAETQLAGASSDTANA